MHRPKLLRTLLSLVIGEHVCSPPDQTTAWTLVSQAKFMHPVPEVYVCPECGQHMVREDRLKSVA